MNKGFYIEETLDSVKGRVEKILSDAQGAAFNACFNSARGTLAGGKYAQFGWVEKDGKTVLTIEARSASDIEEIYGLLFTDEGPTKQATEEDSPEE